MNKKLLIILILGIVVFFSLCAKNERTQATLTPQGVPKIQTPRVTPPPGIFTPLTPDYYIGKFVEYFNERNVTALYDLFSDEIKRNHSIKELETALKFAEEHNITIIEWRMISGRFSYGNVTVWMKIGKDDEIIDKTIKIPMIYKPFRKNSEIFYIGYIDDWILDDILNQTKIQMEDGRVLVYVKVGPIDLRCFNGSYLITESDYILDCTVDRVDLKADMYSGIYSYVYLTVDRYIKGNQLPSNKLKIIVTVRTPIKFSEGEEVRLYLKNMEGKLTIFCQDLGVKRLGK